jgi:hypothetical protein
LIPISINISKTISEFSLSQNQVNEFKSLLLDRLTISLVKAWEKQAKLNLHSTRNEYLKGLKTYREDDFKGGVVLSGSLPVMIEGGAEAFDIKSGMLKSQKAKTSAKGSLYMTIPFKIATPESLAESSIFAGKMTKELYSEAKKLEVGKSIEFKNLPKELQKVKTRDAVGKWNKYEHKTPIFEGLTKLGAKGHGQYGTFRRISNNPDTGSNPNSWIHKGFQARHFADAALSDMQVDLVLIKVRDEFLSKYF